MKKTVEIPRQYWEQSRDKWRGIVTRVKKREKFVDQRGFWFFPVIEQCGYCWAAGKNGALHCQKCRLFQTKNAEQPICRAHDIRKQTLFYRIFFGKKAIFWDFIHEMRKPETDWGRAEKLAEIILRAIENDEKRCGDFF